MQQKHNHILGINQESRTVVLILTTRGRVSIGGIFSTVKLLLVTNKAAMLDFTTVCKPMHICSFSMENV